LVCSLSVLDMTARIPARFNPTEKSVDSSCFQKAGDGAVSGDIGMSEQSSPGIEDQNAELASVQVGV
jgi:hypothetical protein